MQRSHEKGFTLVEMIFTVIIIGILAAVIIPKMTMTSDEAKLHTLKTQLDDIKSVIEIYAAEHNGTYPGSIDVDGSTNADPDSADDAFVQQLTQYTNINGRVSATKTAEAIFGPYFKGGMPINPFNRSSEVVCDTTTTDITVRAWDGTGTAGWHYFTQTGVFVANDSAAHAAL